MSELMKYETIDEALMDADAITGAAEAHGTLCGMVCISGKGDIDNWLTHTLGEFDPQDLGNPFFDSNGFQILLDLPEKRVKALFCP